MLLDAGGVIVLPHRELVRGALTEAGVEIDPAAVPRAHYVAVRELDRAPGRAGGYFPALSRALAVPGPRIDAAVAALSELADRRRSGAILWSEQAPHARRTIERLMAAGLRTIVLTNSDGHAAENLRDAGICHTGAGPGASVCAIVDSGLVGSAKPEPAIFEAALRVAGAGRHEVVHVGDMLSTDVAGARAAGISAVHVDPLRGCRAGDHRHVRTLRGIWRHLGA